MNWVKAADALPKHKEEVLVRYRSIVHLAVYNSQRGKFELRNGGEYDKQDQLLWLKVYEPPAPVARD